MSAPELAEFDENRVTEESRLFATDLFARFPELRQYAAMERLQESEEWSLAVIVPSPSGDPESKLWVWMEGGLGPSVGFGHWHTHEDCSGSEKEEWRGEFLDLIAGILDDRLVLWEEKIGEEGQATFTMLREASDKEGLIEELTDPDSSGRLRLRSWSGKLDRVVSLDDLDQEDAT